MQQTKEIYRDRRGIPWLASLAQDLRFGVRMLRKNPGFTAVGMITLALGIGANTSIFSFVDAVLLRPLPFPEPDQVVRVCSTRGGLPIEPSPLDARDLANESRTFEGIALYAIWPKNVSQLPDGGDAEQAYVGMVQQGWFGTLRIAPVLGRLFTSEEGRPGHHYVAALSEAFWRARFGADPALAYCAPHILKILLNKRYGFAYRRVG
jgi:hypothetical protein